MSNGLNVGQTIGSKGLKLESSHRPVQLVRPVKQAPQRSLVQLLRFDEQASQRAAAASLSPAIVMAGYAILKSQRDSG